MIDSATSGGESLQVLNVVIATPEARGGAIRAGLLLGDHLTTYVDVDTVKMRGDHDELLSRELNLQNRFSATPSRTVFRDLANLALDTSENYENTMIWTELRTPRSLQTYDLVHIHNSVPLWGLLIVVLRCRQAGVPYVMTTHGISKVPQLPRNMYMSRFQQIIFEYAYLKPYKYVLQHACHLIALSETDEERIRGYFPSQSVSVIPNGVLLDSGETDQSESKPRIPEGQSMILFVGKIMESKGISDLLDAYHRLETDCTLLAVGPPENERLVERMESTDFVDIRYLGYVDRQDLHTLYHDADLFVFPTRSDVFPLVTLEAMASGTPVVSTTVGGIPEQITESTGRLVPPESPDRIAAAIDKLLSDDRELERMGEAAARRVTDEFSWDSVAMKTAEVYEKCR